MRVPVAALAAALLLLPVAACGNDYKATTPNASTSDDAFMDGGAGAPAEDPTVVVRNLLTALADGNGEAACGILGPKITAEAVAEAGAADCVTAYSEPDEYIAHGLTAEKNLVATPGYDDGSGSMKVQWRHEDDRGMGKCDEFTTEPTGPGGALQVNYIDRADVEDTQCEYGE